MVYLVHVYCLYYLCLNIDGLSCSCLMFILFMFKYQWFILFMFNVYIVYVLVSFVFLVYV